MNYYRYRGMSYEQLSREISRLLKDAADSGNWFNKIEQLEELIARMKEAKILMQKAA